MKLVGLVLVLFFALAILPGCASLDKFGQDLDQNANQYIDAGAATAKAGASFLSNLIKDGRGLFEFVKCQFTDCPPEPTVTGGS